MLKNILVIGAVALVLSGCADNKKICGKDHETYGLFNKDEYRDPDVKYHLSVGNVIWSAVLVETIIAPIYFLGFSLYEPTEPLNACPAKP